MSAIVRNQFGAFCAVCQHHLYLEEDSFDCCDVCGGEGFPGKEDDGPFEVVDEGENWIEIAPRRDAGLKEQGGGSAA